MLLVNVGMEEQLGPGEIYATVSLHKQGQTRTSWQFLNKELKLTEVCWNVCCSKLSGFFSQDLERDLFVHDSYVLTTCILSKV